MPNPSVPNLPSIAVPNAAAAYSPLSGAFDALTQYPQVQQQLESNKIDLENKRLQQQQLKDTIESAKQQALVSRAQQQLTTLDQLGKADPGKWAKNPQFSKVYADAFKQASGGEAPLNPDGTLDDSLFKPTFDKATQKEIDIGRAMQPGPAKSAYYSRWAGVSPEIANAPAEVTDAEKAKILEINSRAGHYVDMDRVAANREHYYGIKVLADADLAAGRKTAAVAEAGKYQAEAYKATQQGMQAAKEAQTHLLAAQARMKTAQNTMQRGGGPGVASAKAFVDSYDRLNSDLVRLDATIATMANTPAHDDDTLNSLIAQKDQLKSQIDSLAPQLSAAQQYLTTNQGWAFAAGTGVGTGRPPEVTDVTGRGSRGFAGPPSGSYLSPNKAQYFYNGHVYDAKTGNLVK